MFNLNMLMVHFLVGGMCGVCGGDFVHRVLWAFSFTRLSLMDELSDLVLPSSPPHKESLLPHMLIKLSMEIVVHFLCKAWRLLFTV